MEVYDRLRDARTFPGGMPVVAHPPCAQWSRLKHMAKDDPETKALGPYCVDVVRREGGVLEHPAFSGLWSSCGLPEPGRWDAWGWTMVIDQLWFGFGARKRTWLYVVGVAPAKLPAYPLRFAWPTHAVSGFYFKERQARRPGVKRLEKDAAARTVPELATWLLGIATASRSGGI